MMKNFNKKESPLPTLISLGGGSGGSLYPSLGESYFIGVFGTTGNDFLDHSIAIAIDSSENIFISTCSYGLSSENGSFTKTPLIFKYNKKGEFQWQRTVNMSDSVNSQDMICDSSGDIYITGETVGHGLILKINSSGTLQWAKSFGTTSSEEYRGIAIDSSDNVYAIGYGYKRNSNVSSWADHHVVKYNSSGTKQWHRCIGDFYTGMQGWCMDVDSSSNYYHCGNVNDGGYAILVGKFSSTHVRSWQKRIYGGSTSCNGGIVVDDSSGSVHIVGDTTSSATGSRDICIIKLDSSGSISWQRLIGIASRSLYGRDVAIDNSGNVYIIGTGPVDYQGYPVYPYTSTMDAIIIAKYNSSGTLQWKRFMGAKFWGGYTDVDQGQSIAVDPTGKNLYIAGVNKYGNFGGYGNEDVVWAKLPTDGSGIGTYSGPGSKDMIYADATELTSKGGSLSITSYNTDHQSMSDTGYPYTEYSPTSTGYVTTASKTTVEVVT